MGCGLIRVQIAPRVFGYPEDPTDVPGEVRRQEGAPRCGVGGGARGPAALGTSARIQGGEGLRTRIPPLWSTDGYHLSYPREIGTLELRRVTTSVGQDASTTVTRGTNMECHIKTSVEQDP